MTRDTTVTGHLERPVENGDEYKQLKERMKADFKQIRKAVKKGRPLDAALVRTFCSDARLMTTYPGKGDEYYAAFREQVESLAEAAEQGDRDMLLEAVTTLRRIEKACHNRFK